MVFRRMLKMFSSSSNKDMGAGEVFPMISEDDTPSLDELSEADSDSEAEHVVARKNEYRTKEDEDVAVFMGLVEKMSVKSLLFILQGHVRSMHNIPETQWQQALQQAKECESKRQQQQSSQEQCVRKVKKLRFAEIMGGQQIRESVREIPNKESFEQDVKQDMWWCDDEMKKMRREATRVVTFFKRNRPEYAISVGILTQAHLPDSDDLVVEHHMKKLTQDSYPRGLEPHIVKALGDHRKQAVSSVLREQEAFRKRAEARSEDIDVTAMWQAIRGKYTTACRPCKSLALKMAECDHVEALKASISSWGRPACRWASS